MSGRTFISPHVTSGVVDSLLRGASGMGESAFGALTPREREVLQLTAEGKSTKEVAFHLHLSVKTVETHRRAIMDKLGIFSVAELTKYAIREGLTSV
jgi:DNA-binding NarL/FixJ family response regulator